MTQYEMVIGLEVHAQLLTRSKIFCGCRNEFGGEHNSHGCPVCLGLPGALPVLNRRVVEMAVMMGIAVGCSIAPRSIFARKNYFYPDLPKGYQISQYDLPICKEGTLDITVGEQTRTIRINRVHLEEDAGKLVHDQDVDSLFDVNRCGTPLIEIVTEPDMRSGAEAYEYLTSIRRILEYCRICDCNMEEGSLRCDANISIRPVGQTTLGTKTELKNMNSFRGVEKAIEYEFKRQIEVVTGGGTIVQQTFLWDSSKNRTVPMRTKEDAHDYRYFPEPDLQAVLVESAWIDSIQAQLPELPNVRRKRFVSEFGIGVYEASVITDSRSLADYYEAVAAACKDRRLAANWIMGEILRIVNESGVAIDALKTTPKRLAALLTLVTDGVVSAQSGKKIIDMIESQDKDPDTLVREEGLGQVSDTSLLEALFCEVMDKNPAEVERYKNGDAKLSGFFIGQVMKATKGKGNPAEIGKLLKKLMG